MSLRNLGLTSAEVDEITRSIFGTEPVAAPNQTTATQQAAPVAPGSGLTFMPAALPMRMAVARPVAATVVTGPLRDNKTIRDSGAALLPAAALTPAPVKKSSVAGPVAVGAGAGLLVGGPVGAAIGAGAGFLFSKLR